MVAGYRSARVTLSLILGVCIKTTGQAAEAWPSEDEEKSMLSLYLVAHMVVGGFW
jgi:hypothetical protein